MNLTAEELEDFLEAAESKSVGVEGRGDESTGHRSGRRVVQILRTKKSDLTDENATHVRTDVGYVHRNLAQRPAGDSTDSAWRYH